MRETMTRSSISSILLLICGIALSSVTAFAPTSHLSSRSTSFSHQVEALAVAKLDDTEQTYSPILVESSSDQPRGIMSSIGGLTTGLFASVSVALADYYTDGAEDDLEIESLPPPWVPIIFAIVIIGGVGVLTSSLGDVMYDEASLGMQSGAQAKKERERSRASYFKKK